MNKHTVRSKAAVSAQTVFNIKYVVGKGALMRKWAHQILDGILLLIGNAIIIAAPNNIVQHLV